MDDGHLELKTEVTPNQKSSLCICAVTFGAQVKDFTCQVPPEFLPCFSATEPFGWPGRACELPGERRQCGWRRIWSRDESGDPAFQVFCVRAALVAQLAREGLCWMRFLISISCTWRFIQERITGADLNHGAHKWGGCSSSHGKNFLLQLETAFCVAGYHADSTNTNPHMDAVQTPDVPPISVGLGNVSMTERLKDRV
nr:uncharacterized protein LOC129462518 isoform X1 [Symphalangus syndactylus]